MTVRGCVDDLILMESADLVVDLAFDDSGGVSWQASVRVGRQDISHLLVVISSRHDHSGVALVC